MTQRKTYSQEFKIEAVRRAQEHGFAQTARDLGINPNLIHKWRNRLEEDGERAFPGQGNPRDAQLAQLQRDNKRLREENEILKKAVGIFSSRPR